MKFGSNILFMGVLGVGAWYFLIKKDVLGIMAAGGGDGTTSTEGETAGLTGPTQTSPNPAIPGASIFPGDQGGFYKGIEYPNLAAVFPTNPAIGYRPPAFRTSEEMAVYKHVEQPPGMGPVPVLAIGQILLADTNIGGTIIPAGYRYIGNDPATGKMIFEEPDDSLDLLPPDMAPDTVAVVNTTLPDIDIITYIDKDGRHKEIKKKITGLCNACLKSGNAKVCTKCIRGKIVKVKKKKKKKRKSAGGRKSHAGWVV